MMAEHRANLQDFEPNILPSLGQYSMSVIKTRTYVVLVGVRLLNDQYYTILIIFNMLQHV